VNTLGKNKQNTKERIAVVLLSGGLDSATTAAFAKKRGYDVDALTIHYGQALSKEIQCAQAVAKKLNIKQKIVDISNFKDIAWHSALTSPKTFKVSQQNAEKPAQDIPLTYVPLRNSFFIVLAAAYLESEILQKIEKDHVKPDNIDAKIFIAANALDYAGYPDCRPEYYKKINSLLKLASKVGTQYNVQIKVEAPLLHKTNKDIVKMGIRLNAPLELTWSCYVGGEVPCGKCDACQLRAQGFKEAGKEDPIMANLRKEGKL
jgi:7-cyano-7-deazaguanine synthase